MKITRELLKEKKACAFGLEWFLENYPNGADLSVLVRKLLEIDRFDYANWLLTKLFDKTQAVKYAIFVVEQVIDIYEDKYPNDKRPRKVIEVAKKCLNKPSNANLLVAAKAAKAANAAAIDAEDANTFSVAYAANAIIVAILAEDVKDVVADAVAAAAADVNNKIKTTIIEYGLSLIQNEEQ